MTGRDAVVRQDSRILGRDLILIARSIFFTPPSSSAPRARGVTHHSSHQPFRSPCSPSTATPPTVLASSLGRGARALSQCRGGASIARIYTGSSLKTPLVVGRKTERAPNQILSVLLKTKGSTHVCGPDLMTTQHPTSNIVNPLLLTRTHSGRRNATTKRAVRRGHAGHPPVLLLARRYVAEFLDGRGGACVVGARGASGCGLCAGRL